MKRISHFIELSVLILLLTSQVIVAQQETIRVMQYNILEYTNSGTGGSSSTRDLYFRTILDAVAPDIVTAAEISSESNANYFLSDVLNSISTPNQYNIGTFVTNANKSTDNNAIYYKPSKFTYISTEQLTNYSYGNHPIYEDQLYNNLTGDKIYIYGVHLTSNTYGGGAESQRNTEASAINSMVTSLPSGSFYMASGDFNLYDGGNEDAYSTLLDEFVEPLDLPSGNSWTSSTYYKYYTLGTRKDGSLYGDTGGMQYKIDFIFNSQSIVDNGGVHYIGPFVTYGNDGNHHLQSVNSGTNNAVSSTVATALYNASDHLPVYADYTFAVPGTINPPYPGSIVFTQVGINDGSGNNYIEFMTLYRINLTSLKITNNPVQSNGTIATGNTFDLNYTNWTDVPAGTFIRLGTNLIDDNDANDRVLQYDGVGSGTLPNLTSGSNQLIAYTGTAPTPTYYIAGIHWGDTQGWTSSSNAPFDTPSSSNITLTSAVAYNWHYSASVNGNLYTTRNSLTTSGNWSSATSAYHDLTGNITNTALPVELSSFTGNVSNREVNLQWRTETEVNNYGFEVQRSSQPLSLLPVVGEKGWIDIGFVPGSGNSNSPKNYSFADNSLPSGKIYYRLKQEDNDGKFEYSNIVELDNDVSPNVELLQNYPNPFNPVSTIEYTIPTDGFVSLKVYDILGREVTLLVNEKQNAGKHFIKFNGASLASGIYFYVLTTDNLVLSKKMNLLK